MHPKTRFLLLPLLFACTLAAQPKRILAPVDESRRVTIHDAHRVPVGAADLGPVDADRQISIMLLFTRTPAQQSDIEKFLNDRAHERFTPEQTADRWGLHPDDVAAARAWLESHGFAIDHQARGRNWIGFHGTAAQIEQGLGTSLHRYRVNGEEHFANTTPATVPSAIAPVTGAFLGLDDFNPRPVYNFNGIHLLAPDDIAIIYDIMPLYNATPKIDGTGQTIAIVGDTDLETGLADIHRFKQTFNLTTADPKLVLYGTDPGVTGGLSEADLDIEWAGAVARNASLVYVYAVLFEQAVIYAIDQNLATVISASYSACEQNAAEMATLFQSIIQQANAQGITFLAGSADAGAAACDDWFHEPEATNGLGIGFPASIPEATAVGGAEFNEGTTPYWNITNSANDASALGYIPEMAWNDTAAMGVLAGSTGGHSILYSKPAWQTGPGVLNDGVRDTPDVAMAASGYHDAYVSCTGGQCVMGGGTSYATPVFAGIVALLNQSLVSRGVISAPGLGNINPELYRLAVNVPTAFHDITTGDNIVPCVIGTPDCTTGSFGYTAGPGYDMVTGLGSVDVANLLTAWGTPVPTVMKVSPSATSVTMSQPITLLITISPLAGSGAPTGTIYVNQSGTAIPWLGGSSVAPGEIFLGSAALVTSGNKSTASVTISPGQLTAGSDTITVTYSGDPNFNGTYTTVPVTVTMPTGHSVVVPSPSANYYGLNTPYPPAFENPSLASNQFPWGWGLQLKEVAGVATTITTLSVTINGVTTDLSSLIASGFGTDILPADGSIAGGFESNLGTAPTTFFITAGGEDASGYQWSTTVPLPAVAGPNAFVFTTKGGPLVNAASFENVYAPGMIMGIFGSDLTTQLTGSASAQEIPLPVTLLGSSAMINGVAAPYYYASGGFLNIQIPYQTQPGIAVLTITGFGGQSTNYSFKVQATAPGIFVNPANNMLVPMPAQTRGLVEYLYITGDGQLNPALQTGMTPASSTPISQLPAPVAPVVVTVGGIEAQIQFIGVIPGVVGATQVNFVVPQNAPAGMQPVVVTVGGVASQTAYMTVN
jgi:uncharacterized protein (TIGR03437 family)